MGAQEPMEKPQWRATALAIAAAILLGVSASDASALALGRVTVQSALGEPLRADIEIPEITAEEVASLRASIASPDAFRAAGLDYNPSLSGVTITLQRRADGKHFLRLTSQRPVNDPFMDLILEANWSSGRIVRDYTMLFDPPNLRQAPTPMAAQVTPAARPPAETSARAGTPPVGTALPPTRSTPGRRAAAERSAATKPDGGGKQVTVKSGDTAGKIAAAQKPIDVSLDQMLVAMLRSNPEAFIGGNINRLRSGAVLQMPTTEELNLVPTNEARQTIVAQSRDFNEFRRRLAEGLPTTQVGAADRQASGKLQAQVDEKKAAAPTPDKLTLSKGAIEDKARADKVASDRAARDAATRLAELNKNISDLNKFQTGTAQAPVAPVTGPLAAQPAAATPPVASSSAVSPAAATSASAAVVAATPAPAATAPAASAPGSAPVTQSSASAPAVPAPAAAATPKPKSVPVPPPETSLIDDVFENPIVPATVGGLLAFLLGFVFYRSRQRKKSSQVDSSFLESRLQPDSFFGASGGQRIDTNEGSPTGSSMVYSPSQLDAAGDVDPVAEADVYLAYGRDLQAEEILKEAMRTTPQRVAVHTKLLEIYSKRRDAKAFELVATEAYGLTQGHGPDWEHICELGQELDPSNTLYRPGGQPSEGALGAVATAPAAADFSATMATQALPVAAPALVDLDLDLDFSIGDDEPTPAPDPAASQQTTLAMNVPPAVEPMPALDMDFGAVALDQPKASSVPSIDLPKVPTGQPARLDAPDLTLPANSLDFDLEPAPAQAPPPPAPVAVAAGPAVAQAAPALDAGMIEFDLGALSLDLDTPPAAAQTAKTFEASVAASTEPDTDDAPLSTAASPLSTGGFEDTGGDPLATKLALAEEFNAIGDPDGARSLAEEVLAEASGDLKNKAQRFLAEIS
jgi:pilus assembly protein FimV